MMRYFYILAYEDDMEASVNRLETVCNTNAEMHAMGGRFGVLGVSESAVRVTFGDSVWGS